MGDRRNIIVEFNDVNSVALYTHWSGSSMKETLARALDRGRGRWDDPTYLTRIIFSQMIADDNESDVIEPLMSETGFGIEPFTTGFPDYCEAAPGYDLLVRWSEKTVQGDDGGTEKMYGFEDFIEKFLPETALA